MDQKDLNIIELLKADAWMTCSDIGEKVHLSHSSVQRRIARMKADGTISGATINVDQKLLGRKLRLYLLLELREDHAGQLQKLVHDLRDHAEVSRVDLLAGKFDILLILDCKDTDTFAHLAMNIINANENVRHCWTLTRIQTLHPAAK